MKYGAETNHVDSCGNTPLFYAASAGSSANMMELLDTGHADVNFKNNKGKTAIRKARSYDTVMLLTKYGADTKNYFLEGKLIYEVMKWFLTISSRVMRNCWMK